MQDDTTEQGLKDRLRLIEKMIAEGRRHTESWGWTFVLWGLTYYVAMAWAKWGHNVWAWPVTAAIAVIITVAVATMQGGNHPGTTLGRAIGAIWIALGVSMFLVFMALGLSGRLTDPHVFMAMISAMLGMANGASALLLRWKVQMACAVVWWTAAVATCFGNEGQSTAVFLAAIFLGQIVFGIYCMIAQGQKNQHYGPTHA